MIAAIGYGAIILGYMVVFLRNVVRWWRNPTADNYANMVALGVLVAAPLAALAFVIAFDQPSGGTQQERPYAIRSLR